MAVGRVRGVSVCGDGLHPLNQHYRKWAARPLKGRRMTILDALYLASGLLALAVILGIMVADISDVIRQSRR